MKNLILVLVAMASLLKVDSAEAQNRSNKKAKPQPTLKRQQPTVRSQLSVNQRKLSDALTLVRNSQYERAATLLYNLSRAPDLKNENLQIKYILGNTLLELKLYQVAAFQYVDVIRRDTNRKYTKQALERLIIAADALGDDTLLNYAVSRINLEDFPAKSKDMIFFRLGEVKMQNEKYDEAIQAFMRVRDGTRYYWSAQFNRALSLMEAKRPLQAITVYQEIINARSKAPVTDSKKVSAQMGIARAFYQAQRWEESIEAYRKIPRDTKQWHDALFELSWAYLRAAKFRSVLSNFQSLHSPFYQDFYMPESLILRSIVYLYICQYDEMEKVLTLFEKTYGPVRVKLGDFMTTYGTDPVAFLRETERSFFARKSDRTTALKIPIMAANQLLSESNVKRSRNYLKMLRTEQKSLSSINGFSRSALAAYGSKILRTRIANTERLTGEMIRNHMTEMRNELRGFYEQGQFARYEMISGQREQLKKKIAGKDISEQTIDAKIARDFYVKNGYEYWPFDGEFWLDEIGNYHYLGKQSCE